MRNLVTAALMLGGILYGIVHGESAANNPSAVEMEMRPPADVTTVQLRAAYHNDKPAAEKVFRNRKLIVRGIVEYVDAKPPYSVTLQLGGPVQAKLSFPSQGVALRLKPPIPVTMRCLGAGLLNGEPLVDDCDFL